MHSMNKIVLEIKIETNASCLRQTRLIRQIGKKAFKLKNKYCSNTCVIRRRMEVCFYSCVTEEFLFLSYNKYLFFYKVIEAIFIIDSSNNLKSIPEFVTKPIPVRLLSTFV